MSEGCQYLGACKVQVDDGLGGVKARGGPVPHAQQWALMAYCWHISLSVLHLQSQDIAYNDCRADVFASSVIIDHSLKDFAESKLLTDWCTLDNRLSKCNISQKIFVDRECAKVHQAAVL